MVRHFKCQKPQKPFMEHNKKPKNIRKWWKFIWIRHGSKYFVMPCVVSRLQRGGKMRSFNGCSSRQWLSCTSLKSGHWLFKTVSERIRPFLRFTEIDIQRIDQDKRKNVCSSSRRLLPSSTVRFSPSHYEKTVDFDKEVPRTSLKCSKHFI